MDLGVSQMVFECGLRLEFSTTLLACNQIKTANAKATCVSRNKFCHILDSKQTFDGPLAR
jgi:hypothetical protein